MPFLCVLNTAAIPNRLQNSRVLWSSGSRNHIVLTCRLCSLPPSQTSCDLSWVYRNKPADVLDSFSWRLKHLLVFISFISSIFLALCCLSKRVRGPEKVSLQPEAMIPFPESPKPPFLERRSKRRREDSIFSGPWNHMCFHSSGGLPGWDSIITISSRVYHEASCWCTRLPSQPLTPH